jgi:RNA recognition motif-containing protein
MFVQGGVKRVWSHRRQSDEGRRLYIGNLAYATTEEELKEFFKAYTM